ncbi:ABC transporter substrate-binding protein [Opitutaceae bacterium TAV5]|nr:ABC transporter substrate-binding protein [Opitutaceae bacterium TAV5]
MQPPRLHLRIAALTGVAIVLLSVVTSVSGCRRAPADDDERVIRVWSHQGQEAENRAMRAIAEAFNAAHAARGIRVEIAFFPDFQYTEKLAIAAAARDLPDVFDMDGPLVARLVDAGLLAPLDAWIDDATRADFLPTLLEQGTIDGKLYALGAFDSAVVLYYDRELLARAGVIPPPPDSAGWTWDEFLAACRRLRDAGIEPLALHMDDSSDEWFTYAFSPVVWSGGGTLIETETTTGAEAGPAPAGHNARSRVRGVLASDANVRSLQGWQQLFTQNFAATDPVDPDPFGNGKVAMDWSGHWMARTHLERKGDRLGVMPLPRAGAKPAAPCGSWCWGISSHARDPELAALWLRRVTDPRHGVEPIVRANGAVPGRRSAFAAFPEYETPPYSLFRRQLETTARARPRTPFYATLTQRFAAALRDISRGADVAARLRQAEDEIQRVIDRRGAARPRPKDPERGDAGEASAPIRKEVRP